MLQPDDTLHRNKSMKESLGGAIGCISTGRLTLVRHFDIFETMETKEATHLLAALAQESRLAVFRLLVEAGPEGFSAGAIGERLGLPPATLSFHLSQLSRAGLVTSRQQSRFIFYSADFARMDALIGFLFDNCCGGQPCLPSVRGQRRNPAETT